MGADLNLKLKVFEGPLDLLCHLIQVNEIDIYDIPITEITHQYMTYLNELQSFQMEVASEFIVMAATLMEIKSRTLLPANRSAAAAGEEEGSNDPREELVRQLLEYQQFQQAAAFLKSFENGQPHFFKPPEDLYAFVQSLSSPEPAEPEILDIAGPEVLASTFCDLMRIYLNSRGEEKQQPITMAREQFTIAQQSEYVLDQLKKERALHFTTFFLTLNHSEKIIVTFLSLLELMRTNQVMVTTNPKGHDLIIVSRHSSYRGNH
ncbi:segregation and condensation protein A [Anoxynatronum sibiricum]|uniref:Segregation and condensation protein A n=1 Tax=Anoxynatronum sibiricum TaxID=210623 RepID=A0ABU9VQA4_9CLOT